MNEYVIKNSSELTEAEIKTILENWDVEEWKRLKPRDFKKKFEKSEFHLLTDSGLNILCIARINFHFKVQINETVYPIAELVGFVATEILKGYGKELLGYVSGNLKSRNIEAIGFCRNKFSKFYEFSGFKIFYYKVKYIRERRNESWYTPVEDDDIISLTLNDNTIQLFENLNETNPAYLLFE